MPGGMEPEAFFEFSRDVDVLGMACECLQNTCTGIFSRVRVFFHETQAFPYRVQGFPFLGLRTVPFP